MTLVTFYCDLRHPRSGPVRCNGRAEHETWPTAKGFGRFLKAELAFLDEGGNALVPAIPGGRILCSKTRRAASTSGTSKSSSLARGPSD